MTHPSANAYPSQKANGAYYTPESVVAKLVRWAVRRDSDRLLDPACGDGRFVAAHRNSFGVEQNAEAAATAKARAPWMGLHQGDFFDWAARTRERFDCAAGNPPFIRYQTLDGTVRKRALALCADLGAGFSGLTASWAPFLVATASCLRPGGRMAFVVPASIGHAPYAAPLLDYLVRRFDTIRVVAIRSKLFPQLSEDCWLLLAEGFGGATSEILFTPVEDLGVSDTIPPADGECVNVPVGEWRHVWNRRLRPYLLKDCLRSLYREVAARADAMRFGVMASVGIGYVSGANDFFHLRPSDAHKWSIPDAFLFPTVRTSRVLPSWELTARVVEGWRQADDPMLLLCIPRDADLPASVVKYLDSEAGHRARERYKCRNREPWYTVPDVRVPDCFLTYMSGLAPNLVRNAAGVTCSNALHAVRIRDRRRVDDVLARWRSPYVQLSCEIEGHALGGGMLKLEPREAAQIVLPSPRTASHLPRPALEEAISTMQYWRHYR